MARKLLKQLPEFYPLILKKYRNCFFNDSRRLESPSEENVWSGRITRSKIKREEFGFLTLENLRPGDYRELRAFEVQKLVRLAKNEI